MATSVIDPNPSTAASAVAASRDLNDLQALLTECPNQASEGFDTKSALEIARIIKDRKSVV